MYGFMFGDKLASPRRRISSSVPKMATRRLLMS
jgi:hypothetical protein